MATFLKGLVKAVPSGDSIVVMDTSRKTAGAPPEKRLTLSGVTVPRLGVQRPDGSSTADEPCAWEAREFVRNLTIGKVVEFQLQGGGAAQAPQEGDQQPQQQQRSYAIVRVDGNNLAELLVKNGLAKPRVRAGGEPDELLVSLEQIAISEHVGFYCTPAHPVRAITTDRTKGFSPDQFLKTVQGKAQQVIVEYVFGPSLLRVTVLPSAQCKVYHNLAINLSGIRCPSLKGKTGEPEPFALEAKFFVEARLLHREATVLFEKQENNQLFATLTMPQGNIAEALVRNGFARVSAFSLAECSCSAALCKAEEDAKAEKLRVWQNYTPRTTKQFSGTVVEVISGDTMLIEDASTRDEQRITLSSVRVARPKIDQTKIDPEGAAAKELVRSTLIGNAVTVTVEYTREAPEGAVGGTRAYGTVKCGDVNIAELLASKGLCEVVKHRADDPRASAYDDLLTAQTKAQKEKVGKWASSGFGQEKRLNDLSGDATRAKAFLTNLTRQQFQVGVVDFVMNGGRFKVLLPRHQCIAPVVLLGLYVPQCARRDRPDQPSEPFGDDAYRFSRSLVLQREVQVEVENVDRGGSFLGHIWTAGKKNLATELLKRGLATLQNGAGIERSEHFREYSDAQDYAKTQRVGLWANFDESALAAQQQKQQQQTQPEDQAPPEEFLDAVVTEVTGGNTFYLRPSHAAPQEAMVADVVRRIDANGPAVPKSLAPVGQMVVARFSGDGVWYRARVMKGTHQDKKAGKVNVLFVDYGNSELVPLADVRAADNSVFSLPPQAVPARLAYTKVAPVDDDLGEDAGHLLASLVLDKSVVAKIESRDTTSNTHSTTLEVLLWDAADFPTGHQASSSSTSSAAKSVNAKLLRSGFARPVKTLPKWLDAEVVAELKKANDHARTKHLGMFEYGDVADSDEDDGGMAVRGKRPQK